MGLENTHVLIISTFHSSWEFIECSDFSTDYSTGGDFSCFVFILALWPCQWTKCIFPGAQIVSVWSCPLTFCLHGMVFNELKGQIYTYGPLYFSVWKMYRTSLIVWWWIKYKFLLPDVSLHFLDQCGRLLFFLLHMSKIVLNIITSNIICSVFKFFCDIDAVLIGK